MKFQGGIGNISSVLLYILTCQYTQAGPVIRPSRMVREIYPEVEQEIPDSSSQPQGCLVGDSTYPANAAIPSTTPCLKCWCSGGGVRCEAEACPPARGCRAVPRPGRCCPARQCECPHQGRLYANGERLPQREGRECSVCYCRGGHVQCAEVGCYTRGDCEPRFVRGECCPKYDHCPPRDPLADRIITSAAGVEAAWPPHNATDAEDGSGDDDVVLGDEPKRAAAPVTFSIKEIEKKGSGWQGGNVQVSKVDKSTQTSPLNPQITIQEVIPARTEFVPPRAAAGGGDQLLGAADSESVASDKAEVYERRPPPPVLRIGDQLLFIKQGQLVPEKDASTPSSVITLIGAEGLQIGLGSGELIDHEILPVSAENTSSTSDANITTQTTSDTSISSESSEETSTAKITSLNDITDEETTEQNETSKEYITVSYTVDSSTPTDITSKSSAVPSSTTSNLEPEQAEYIPEENPYYPAIPEDIMILSQDDITTDVTVKTSKKVSTTESVELSTLTSMVPLKTTGGDVPLPKKIDEPKILPAVLELRNNATINTTSSTEKWLKNEPTKITIPLVNEKAALPNDLLEMIAPSDFNNEETDYETTVFTSPIPSTQKFDKIMTGPSDTTAVEKSKETLELNEELFESMEYTTIPPIQRDALISSEDASVELIQNDSAPIDTSDLVEMVPGYETTEKVPPKIHIEEHLKTVDGLDGVTSPKHDVEMIDVSGGEIKTHTDIQDIQKRDVVKKVLKDTFENPKENIQTDVLEPNSVSVEVPSDQNEEQNNVVKPNMVVIHSLVDNSTRIKVEPSTTSVPVTQNRQYHQSKLTD